MSTGTRKALIHDAWAGMSGSAPTASAAAATPMRGIGTLCQPKARARSPAVIDPSPARL